MTANNKLQNIINNMKCEYADKAYSNFIYNKYKIGCLKELDDTIINIAEEVLNNNNIVDKESVLYGTDIHIIWTKNPCSTNLLERILKYDKD